MCRMTFRLAIGPAAQESLAPIIAAMTSELVMHPIDELRCELQIPIVTGRARETEKIADRESVGPQIPIRGTARSEAGSVGELHHQLDGIHGDLTIQREKWARCGLR